MALTRLTHRIASALCSFSRAYLDEYMERGKHNEYVNFSHYNFFYSYPEFGKKWPNEQPCEFHRVETACNCCGKKPERNYAGVGTLYAYKSLSSKRPELVLFCSSCKHWRDSEQFQQTKPIQFKLL